MKAVKDKDALQKIVDSWFASSKNLWKLIDCGMSSTVKIGLGYGIQSNAEVLGYEEEISRGIFAFRELGAGYSFERKPCFVCGSLSHLIKDCDYYEKKMAREAAFKSTRVVKLSRVN
ncbi:hypothetical protein Tco_1268603 [Tanacetum coccineum]